MVAASQRQVLGGRCTAPGTGWRRPASVKFLVDGVLFLEQDGGSQRHVLVDGEGLRDGGRDVVTEVVLHDPGHQHRTTPLRTLHTPSSAVSNSNIPGFVDIDCNSLFNVIDSESVHTCGHNLTLCQEHCNVNCRLNAFYLPQH